MIWPSKWRHLKGLSDITILPTSRRNDPGHYPTSPLFATEPGQGLVSGSAEHHRLRLWVRAGLGEVPTHVRVYPSPDPRYRPGDSPGRPAQAERNYVCFRDQAEAFGEEGGP